MKFDKFEQEAFVSVLPRGLLKTFTCLKFVVTVANHEHIEDAVALKKAVSEPHGLERLLLPLGRVEGKRAAKLTLGRHHRDVRLDQLVDPRQQIVARILDPALFSVGNNDHFCELDHLLEQLEERILDRDQHSHVFPRHLLEVGEFSLVLRQEIVRRQHRVVPVKHN